MRSLVVLGVLCLISSTLGQQQCDGNTPNTYPFITDPPQFVSSVPNGSLYAAGVGQISPVLNVLHVFGSPYAVRY